MDSKDGLYYLPVYNFEGIPREPLAYKDLSKVQQSEGIQFPIPQYYAEFTRIWDNIRAENALLQPGSYLFSFFPPSSFLLPPAISDIE